MAKSKKSKKKKKKRLHKVRNPYALSLCFHKGKGNHGDKRQENNKLACRNKVQRDQEVIYVRQPMGITRDCNVGSK